jgi:predicted dinucleotide-binding enzyme
MRIVLGTLEFGAIGGAGTYTLTVATELQSLGHDVTIFAEETGELARVAEERGIRVAAGEGALPDDCDVIYAQDRATSYLLADRFPGIPQALCMHSGSSVLDRWQPPQLPGVVGAVVVLHERLAKRAAAFAERPEIVRLRQPVDLARFAPRGPIGESPRRVLLLGNNLSADRRDDVIAVLDQLGLECVELGLYGARTTPTPEQEINQVDIVIGSGRSIVEAMACGRAAFVYDYLGGDGWVTGETYEALEGINFAHATSDDAMVAPEALADRLGEYRQSMGSVNLDLARLHHAASRHAEELVALFERLEPGDPPPNTPFREFARMSRVQWQTESRALGASHEARLLSSRLAEAEARAEAAEARAEVAQASLETLRSAPWYRFLSRVVHPFGRRDE